MFRTSRRRLWAVVYLALLTLPPQALAQKSAFSVTGVSPLLNPTKTPTLLVTPPPEATVVYVPSATTSPAAGGRQGLDAFCAAHTPANLSCSAVHALVSVGPGDAIVDMPANYGFDAAQEVWWWNEAAAGGARIDVHWDAMLDGDIDTSQAAGTGVISAAFSGSDWDGTAVDSCAGWTTQGTLHAGWQGDASRVDEAWLGEDAALVWATDAGQNIFRWNGFGFVQQPGALAQIDVAEDGTMWGLDSAGSPWQWVGYWLKRPGWLSQISVGSASQVRGVNAWGNVFQWNGFGWVQLPGGLSHVSIGADGETWGVNAWGNIYRWVSGTWQWVPGALTQVEVGSADHVWGLNGVGQIFRYSAGGWTQIPGQLSRLSVAPDGEVWGIASNGQAYRHNGFGFAPVPSGLSRIGVGHGGLGRTSCEIPAAVRCACIQTSPFDVQDDVLTATRSQTTLLDVTANDSGVVDLTSDTPQHGTVLVSGGALHYTPSAGFEGTDSWSYQATAADGSTATATVTVYVNPADVLARLRFDCASCGDDLVDAADPMSGAASLIHPDLGHPERTTTAVLGHAIEVGDDRGHALLEVPDLLPLDEGTLSLWVRVPPAGFDTSQSSLTLAAQSYAPMPSATTRLFDLLPDDETTARLRFVDEGGEEVVSPPISYEPGRWYMLSVTWSPTRWDLYRDGWTIASNLKAEPLHNLASGGLYVGNQPACATAPCAFGAALELDEVEVYARALLYFELLNRYHALNPNALEANDDVVTIQMGEYVEIQVLDNDPHALVVQAVDGAVNGTASVFEDDQIAYTPDPGFFGTEVLTYIAAKANGDTAKASVTIHVLAPLSLVDDSASTTRSALVTLNPLANDTAASQLVTVAQPAHGTAFLIDATTVGYLPVDGFGGDDSFAYTAMAATGAMDAATVTVTVSGSASGTPSTILYRWGVTSGELGGKAKADLLCADVAPGSCDPATTTAFLSAGVPLDDMPSDYGLDAGGEIWWWHAGDQAARFRVGHDWADLLDGYIETPGQVGLGVGDAYFWSGAQPDGSEAPSCDAWQNLFSSGTQGDLSAVNGWWLQGDEDGCDAPATLLCACAMDPAAGGGDAGADTSPDASADAGADAGTTDVVTDAGGGGGNPDGGTGADSATDSGSAADTDTGPDAPDADAGPDADADAGPGPGAAPVFSGAWPQASPRRFEPRQGFTVEDKYGLVDGSGGTGPYAGLLCEESCNGFCGLHYDPPQSDRYALNMMAVSDDSGHAFLGINDGEPPPNLAWDIEASFYTRVDKLQAGPGGLTHLASFPLDARAIISLLNLPDPPDPCDKSWCPQPSVLIEDLMLLDIGGVERLVVVGRLLYMHFDESPGAMPGDVDTPVVLGLDPGSGDLRWVIHSRVPNRCGVGPCRLVDQQEIPVSTQSFYTDSRATQVRVQLAPDGRLLLLHTQLWEYPVDFIQFNEATRTESLVYEAIPPVEDPGGPVVLEATLLSENLDGPNGLRPIDFSVDDQGRLYTIGWEDVVPTGAASWRTIGGYALRVFAPDYTLLAHEPLAIRVDPTFGGGPGIGNDNDYWAEHDPGRRLAPGGELLVERALEKSTPTYRAIVVGNAERTDCTEARLHGHKDGTTFTPDLDHPTACPDIYEAQCLAQPGTCPCRGLVSYPVLCSGADATASILHFDDANGFVVSERKTLVIEDAGAHTTGDINAMGPKEGRLALDGHGKLLSAVGYFTRLYDFDRINPRALWRFPRHYTLGTALSGSGPGGSERFLSTWSTGALAVGEMGSGATISRVPWVRQRPDDLSSSLPHMYEQPYADVAYPMAGGRLLALRRQSHPLGIAIRLLESRTEYAMADTDMAPLDPAAGPTTVAMCPAGDSCPSQDIGRFVAAEVRDPSQTGQLFDTPYIYCEGEGATLAEAIADRDTGCDYVEQWGLGAWSQTLSWVGRGYCTEPFLSVQVNNDFRFEGDPNDACGVYPRCDPATAISMEGTWTTGSSSSLTYHAERYFHCAEWTEAFYGRGVGHQHVLANVSPRAWQRCDELGEPVPMRILKLDDGTPPFDVSATDAQGQPAQVVEIGDVVTAQVTCTSGDVTYVIVGGDAVFANGQTTITLPCGSPPVTFTVGGEGVVTLEVSYDGDTGFISVEVRPTQDCGNASSGAGFALCRLPHPTPVGDEDAQESLGSPAVAGEDVLLHDMSYLRHEDDLNVPSIGMPTVIGRTYRSARLPAAGGVMGGWHFAWDQRLVVVPKPGEENDTLVYEKPGNYYDIALHDGSGRADVFSHPGTPPTLVSFVDSASSGSHYWVYDAASERLEGKPLEAKVTAYTSPRGEFSTLKAYDIQLAQPTDRPSTSHPWFDPASTGVGLFEERFYELVASDGTQRIFNCKGQLLKVIDPQHHTISLHYEGGKHPVTRVPELSRIVDTSGRTFTVQWSTIGSDPAHQYRQITRITDPFGRRLIYEYALTPDQSRPLLERVGEELGSVTDPLKVYRATDYRYDDQGRLTEVILPESTHPVLVNTYDANGAITHQRLGDGPDGTSNPVQPGGEWIFVAFSPTNIEVMAPTGDYTTYTLAALSGGGPRVVTNKAWTQTVLDTSAPQPDWKGQNVSSAVTHDANGLILTETTTDGRSLTFGYDARGNLTSQSETPSAAGGLAKSWSWTYDPSCGVLVSETDAAGATTTYDLFPFDPTKPGQICRVQRKRMPTVQDPYPDLTTHDYVETWEYAPTGVLRGLVTVHRLGEDFATSLNEKRFEYQTSPPGAPKRTELSGASPAECNGSAPSSAVRFDVDTRGNVTRMTHERVAGDFVVEQTYDQADRLVKVVKDPSGHAHEKRWTYDRRDQVTRLIEEVRDDFDAAALGIAGVSFDTEVEHSYDLLGRRWATVIDSGVDQPRSFEIRGYDGAGRLVTRWTPAAGADDTLITTIVNTIESNISVDAVLSQSWAPTATALAETGPTLKYETYRYGAGGELIERDISDGVGSEADGVQRYYHDAAARLIVHDFGRSRTLSGNQKAPVRTELSYDGNGLLHTERLVDPLGCTGGATVVQKKTYVGRDLRGNPASVTLEGNDASATVDASGAVSAACRSDVLLSKVDFEYDAWGRITKQTTHRTVIDPDGLLTDTHSSGSSVLHYTYDQRNLRLRQRLSGGGLPPQLTVTKYTGRGQLCYTEQRAEAATTPDFSERLDVNDAGLVIASAESHLPSSSEAGSGVFVSETREYDVFGRITKRTDGVGLEQRMYHDSMGRTRVQVDPKGRKHVLEWDGLGSKVLEETRTSGEAIGTVYDYRGGYLAAQRSFHEPVGTSNKHFRGKRELVKDVFGRDVRIYPYGRDTSGQGQHVLRVYEPSGLLVSETKLNGAQLTYSYDGLGGPTEVLATATGPIAGVDTTSLTKRFTYSGAGNMTSAQMRRGSQPVSTVLYLGDSLGNVLEETQVHHGQYQHKTKSIRATYDARGRRTGLMLADMPANQASVGYEYDAIDRMKKVERGSAPQSGSAHGAAHFDFARYLWAGLKLKKREVWGQENGPATSTFDYNELGQRYRVRHGDGSSDFYESRNWWERTDLAISTSTALDAGGVPIGAAALRSPPTITVGGAAALSHVTTGTPGALVDPLPSYANLATAILSSSYTVHQRDAFGRPTRSTSTTYGAASGRPQLGLSYSTYEGARLKTKQSVQWDHSAGWFSANAQEVSAVDYAYLNGDPASSCYDARAIERVCKTRHLTHKIQNIAGFGDFELNEFPLDVSGGDLGGHSADDDHSYTYSYTDAGAVYDGSNEKYAQTYDLFERLVHVNEKNTNSYNCGIGCAGDHDIAYDALDRRVWEHFEKRSDLFSDRPRRLLYFDGEVVQELHQRYTIDTHPGVSDITDAGRSSYVYGPDDDIAWTEQPWNSAGYTESAYVPLADVNGNFVAFRHMLTSSTALADQILPSATTLLLSQEKPRPYIGRNQQADINKTWRWLARGVERSVFDEMTFSTAGGYVRDLRTDWQVQNWHAQQAFSNAIAENRYWLDIAAVVISAPLFAIAPYSIIAEGLNLAMDGAALINEVTGEGLTLMTGLSFVASVGGLRAGKQANLLDNANPRMWTKAKYQKAGARGLNAKIAGQKAKAASTCKGGSCGIPGEGCFVEGTPVWTSEGMMAIEDVELGDYVLAQSDETGEVQLKQVVAIKPPVVQAVLDLVLLADDGEAESLGVTGEHPFWRYGEGWTPAGELEPGDQVLTAEEGWVEVAEATWRDEPEYIYNFEVEDYHSYFVGAAGVWVHNYNYGGKGKYSIYLVFKDNGDAKTLGDLIYVGITNDLNARQSKYKNSKVNKWRNKNFKLWHYLSDIPDKYTARIIEDALIHANGGALASNGVKVNNLKSAFKNQGKLPTGAGTKLHNKYRSYASKRNHVKGNKTRPFLPWKDDLKDFVNTNHAKDKKKIKAAATKAKQYIDGLNEKDSFFEKITFKSYLTNSGIGGVPTVKGKAISALSQWHKDTW